MAHAHGLRNFFCLGRFLLLFVRLCLALGLLLCMYPQTSQGAKHVIQGVASKVGIVEVGAADIALWDGAVQEN